MDRRTGWFVLNMAQVLGTTRARQLLEICGSPQEILNAPLSTLRTVLPETAAQRIADCKKLPWEAELEKLSGIKGYFVTFEDDNYPFLLKQIEGGPIVLYVRGTLDPDAFCIGIVGTRNPTPYGISMAEKFSLYLSEVGLCVVSGLARGIDTAAHKSALRAHGKTIAVLGSGLMNIYPGENLSLAEQIVQTSAIVSEFPLDARPDRMNFPRRNRIISGMSRAVLVIEAGFRSGALITAHHAVEQNRDVFVIPSDAGKLTGRGNNMLIREGAMLVENPEEIVEQMNLQIKNKQDEPSETRGNQLPHLSELERRIYTILSEQALHFDEIAARCHIPPGKLSEVLTLLEVKGLVHRIAGNTFQKTTG